MVEDFCWTWGTSTDMKQWYIKIVDLDTNEYAMAYYSTDDEDPLRWYESTNSELLKMVIEAESSKIFTEARNKKNIIISSKTFEDIIAANFK